MLPREIQVERWPERSTYDLPLRPIGKLRYFGLLLIGFAALFASVPGGIAGHSLRRVLAGEAAPSDWIFGVFTLVFVAAALMPFGIGMFVLCGRERLVVTRERLKVTEIALIFRWSRRVKLADIEGLQVAAAKGGSQAGPQTLPRLADLGALGASLRNQKKMLLLVGYPKDWLDPLAEELSGIIQLKGSAVPVEHVEPTMAPGAVRNEEIQQQPRSSNARLVETAGGIELELPSKGLWKTSGGLMVFSILWCGFLTVFTGAMLTGAMKSHGRGGGALGVLAFLSIFWLIGLGMFVLALHLGTRRWVLKADGTQLEATLRSALRSRRWQWRAEDIRELVVGDSGMEVNHRRLQELKVFASNGKKAGLLLGRDADELAWVATRLRRVLKVAPPAERLTAG
jgi:hypothetical protein